MLGLQLEHKALEVSYWSVLVPDSLSGDAGAESQRVVEHGSIHANGFVPAKRQLRLVPNVNWHILRTRRLRPPRAARAVEQAEPAYCGVQIIDGPRIRAVDLPMQPVASE